MSAQEAIGLFSICFYVSLAVMAAGFGFAAFAFFRYRIPQVFALMTGKAQRKTVEKMRSSRQLQTEEEIEGPIEEPIEEPVEGPVEGPVEAPVKEAIEAMIDGEPEAETERLDHPPEFDKHPQAKEAMQHPVGGFETIEHLMVIHTDEEL